MNGSSGPWKEDTDIDAPCEEHVESGKTHKFQFTVNFYGQKKVIKTKLK